jgi:hypothetical protein
MLLVGSYSGRCGRILRQSVTSPSVNTKGKPFETDSAREVRSPSQLSLWRAPGLDCSFYDGWRDQPDAQFSHISATQASRLFVYCTFYTQ